MTNEKPVESRFQEYVAFAKKHKLATTLIVIWLVAPTIWSVVVTIKGWNASELEATIRSQSKEINKKNAKIQELQTLLVPFKTIAIEKFTGTEKEALRKLADYVIELQERDIEQGRRIGELQEEVNQTKRMYGPPVLNPIGKNITKTSSGFKAIVQFKPSNNSRVDGYRFKARVVQGEGRIVSFGGSVEHHAMVGGSGTVSEDKMTAEAFFNPLSGNPTIATDVSGEVVVELTGSHLDRGWTLEIK
jgi:hypothetical protein